MSALHDELRDLAGALGADFFGIADLSRARQAIVEQGGPALAEYPRAVSIGVGLMHAIVDQLPRRAERPVTMLYRAHAYDLVNARLDQTAQRLASTLQRAGYRALPVPASQTIDDERLIGLISHKLAAHLAGLGWIGKSCMVITPTAGPRARWATILTDAPLPAGEPLETRCADCQECVDACPVHAFTGRLFREDEPRAARFAAERCKAYLYGPAGERGFLICGMCLYACPHGKKAAERLATAKDAGR